MSSRFKNVSVFSNLGRPRPLGAKKADTPVPDEDELDPDAEDEDEDEDPKSRKSKKARKAEDDQDRQDEDDPDARAARARERSRIAAIVASEPAKANPAAAMHLAVSTAMPRHEAISALAALNGAGPAGAQSSAPQQRAISATAQQIIAAGKKRRGEI